MLLIYGLSWVVASLSMYGTLRQHALLQSHGGDDNRHLAAHATAQSENYLKPTQLISMVRQHEYVCVCR